MTRDAAPDYVAEGMAATFDPEDVEKALIGTFEERKLAVMRLVAGAWRKGWDECEQETRKFLAALDAAREGK